MSETQEGPQSPTPLFENGDELRIELRSFLSTIFSNNDNPSISKSLSRSALYLLKNLPASRDSVLEFYSSLFIASVGKYFSTGEIDEIPNLETVLIEALEVEPISWAPLVSRWSLELLGELSSKYSNKIPKTNNINDVLRIWFECPGARTLINLTSRCLISLMSTQAEKAISALLDTSVKHSPHFDWVVAHIGDSFPEILIHRLLSLGLKNTIAHVSSQIQKKERVNLSDVPKISSVIDILDHLSISQSLLLQNAFSFLFTKASASEDAILPYCLHLSSLSRNISLAFIANIPFQLRNSEVITKLLSLSHIFSLYFPRRDSLIELVSNLILQSPGAEVLYLLLEFIENSTPKIKIIAKELLEFIFSELLALVHQSSSHTSIKDRNPLLESFQSHLDIFLKNFFLSSNDFTSKSTMSLIYYTALTFGKSVSIRTIKYGLVSASTEKQLSHVLRYIKEIELWQIGVVETSLDQLLRSQKTPSLPLFNNLIIFVEHEISKKPPQILSSFSDFLSKNTEEILEKLSSSSSHIPTLLQLLKLIPPNKCQSHKRVSTMHRSIVVVVHSLFRLLKRIEFKDRDEHLLSCESLLRNYSKSPIGNPIVLRCLLEGALNSPYARVFGGKFNERRSQEHRRNSLFRKSKSMMEANIQLGSMPTYPIGSTTVYHAGIIGNGLLGSEKMKYGSSDEGCLSKENTTQNTFIFVNIVFKICQIESVDQSRESCKQLALLLVDLISPDVMYNGLPWPEEDFIKVTMERDLRIQKAFQAHPLLWSLSFGLSEARPSLCYASVLIRALFAVLMTSWSSSISPLSKQSLLEDTIKVLQLMALSQFLPHPLNSVSEILHVLSPIHIVPILNDIWNYMRDNVPSPLSYSISPNGISTRKFEEYKSYKSYCERLRLIMLKHIEVIPLEFKRFFVVLEDKTESEIII